MNYLIYFILPILLLGLFYVFVQYLLPLYLTAPVSKQGNPGYLNVNIGSRVFKLEVADTNTKRMLGLSNRDSLAEDSGMIFIFDKPGIYSFWMKDTRIPLDMIWFLNNKIVYIVQDAKPSSSLFPPVYTPSSTADTVIELNSGESQKLGLKIGDQVPY